MIKFNWLMMLEQEPEFISGVAILLGLIVGSFLNVVILRLPKMLEALWRRECAEFTSTTQTEDEGALSLSSPASSCPSCNHRIRVYENIPIISYLFLRGRCSKCKNKISLRYPLIEGFTALSTLIIVNHFGLTTQMMAALVLTWTLLTVAVIDYETQLIPDRITLPILWLGLLFSLFEFFTDPPSAIIGAVAGYLSLWFVYQIFKILTGKEGMGFGDFKLLALLGAWFGWQALPQIILISAVTGSVLGLLGLSLKMKERDEPIPFGPFIALAGWIYLLWGEPLNLWYRSTF